MIITLYKNSSNNKTINKILSADKNIEGILRNDTNIEYPSLILKGIYTEFNYCYIPIFQRYYFIENIIIHGNTTIIECSIDVLTTYKEDILNSYALLNQASNYNPYFNGGYHYEEKTEFRKYNFQNNFNSEGTLILVTASYPFKN